MQSTDKLLFSGVRIVDETRPLKQPQTMRDEKTTNVAQDPLKQVSMSFVFPLPYLMITNGEPGDTQNTSEVSIVKKIQKTKTAHLLRLPTFKGRKQRLVLQHRQKRRNHNPQDAQVQKLEGVVGAPQSQMVQENSTINQIQTLFSKMKL